MRYKSIYINHVSFKVIKNFTTCFLYRTAFYYKKIVSSTSATNICNYKNFYVKSEYIPYVQYSFFLKPCLKYLFRYFFLVICNKRKESKILYTNIFMYLHWSVRVLRCDRKLNFRKNNTYRFLGNFWDKVVIKNLFKNGEI